jgi:hypothetical protein
VKDHETRVARVCSRLNAERANYIVFGAVAMQLWGTTRATRDIDILIQPTVANARRVLRALATLGFGLAGEQLAQEVASKPVTIVGDTPNVDILTRAWNVRWETARRNVTTFEVEGVPVPTASIDDLIESKRTGRLQDAADIEVLEAIRDLRGL